MTNEPSQGIWQYDLAANRLQAVVPCSDFPSVYAKNIKPFNYYIKSLSDTNLTCAIFPPANYDRHKKYPVVMGNTRFVVAVNGVHGRQWVPCVAAAGAYVVIVERKQWSKGLEQWGDDIMAAYNSLKEEPGIDTSRVYLFSSSAETRYMGNLLTKSPGLWKGGIFLNPGALPDFFKSPMNQSRPRILISVGGDEQEEDRLKKYQAGNLNQGVVVETFIHPGEGHHLVGNAAQLERTRALMHFIFEE